jgi:sensor histidine kinase regulating citrate/malate metabolism
MEQWLYTFVIVAGTALFALVLVALFHYKNKAHDLGNEVQKKAIVEATLLEIQPKLDEILKEIKK